MPEMLQGSLFKLHYGTSFLKNMEVRYLDCSSGFPPRRVSLRATPAFPWKATCPGHSCWVTAELSTSLWLWFVFLASHSLHSMTQWHFLLPFSFSKKTNVTLLRFPGLRLPSPREDLALPGLFGSHPSVCCAAIKPSGRDLSWT